MGPITKDILKNEIDRIGHNLFYLSGTMMHKGQIDFDCGNTFASPSGSVILVVLLCYIDIHNLDWL